MVGYYECLRVFLQCWRLPSCRPPRHLGSLFPRPASLLSRLSSRRGRPPPLAGEVHREELSLALVHSNQFDIRMVFKLGMDCYNQRISLRKATLYWKDRTFRFQVDSPGNVLWPLPKRLLLSPVATDTRRDAERRWTMPMGYERRRYGGGANR